MRKWFAAGGAVLLAIVGIVLWRGDRARADAPVPVRAFADLTAPPTDVPAAAPRRRYAVRAVAPDAPDIDPRTREEARFARYDKDRDGAITKDEFLATRKKAFAKLDKNGDGKLDLEEYAARTEAKFEAADVDRRGKLTPAEFATTAVKRKAKAACPPPEAREADA